MLTLSPVLLVFRVSEESTTTDDFMRGEKAEVRQKMFGNYSIHPERAQLASNWQVRVLLVSGTLGWG